MFSLSTRSYHDTRRWRDTSGSNSEHFDFFRPPPAMARGLARRDAVPWAKLAYTWNFHVLLFHTLLHMVFSWPMHAVVRGSCPRALHCSYPREDEYKCLGRTNGLHAGGLVKYFAHKLFFTQTLDPACMIGYMWVGRDESKRQGLNLSGSWQQGHSATYNTPSRI